MDSSLLKILYTMILFCIPGLFYIWALKDSYRLERFLLGTMLIAWAAFALGMVAIVIGVLEPLINDDSTSEYTLKQATEFLPYVSFFGFIYTFMFGGVGTNAISSSLMESKSEMSTTQVRKMQKQLDDISSKVDSLSKFHFKYLFISVALFITGVVLSLYVWA